MATLDGSVLVYGLLVGHKQLEAPHSRQLSVSVRFGDGSDSRKRTSRHANSWETRYSTFGRLEPTWDPKVRCIAAYGPGWRWLAHLFVVPPKKSGTVGCCGFWYFLLASGEENVRHLRDRSGHSIAKDNLVTGYELIMLRRNYGHRN